MLTTGQKVVCVDAVEARGIEGYHWRGLKENAIYTVAGTGLVHPRDPDQLPCISIAEFSIGVFWAHRFRPVVERKTDIPIFRKMPAPRRQKEDA